VEHPDPILHAALAAYWKVFHILYIPALVAWSRLDLSLRQLQILLQVASTDTVYVSTVATEQGISRSMASLLVQELMELGLVTRTEDPVDRRRSIVRLAVPDADLLGGPRWQEREIQNYFASLSPPKLLALTHELAAIEAILTR
jgi:hypothetical protein